MTEYDRSDTGKIQANLALRVGKLLGQYAGITRHLGEEEKYDATLLICALQTLLTNCYELLEAMKESDKVMWAAAIDNDNGGLGIADRLVRNNTFPGVLTRGRFVEHLRNAVCHPTYSDHRPCLPSTGYSTVPDTTGIISTFVFIDSPWIDRGKFRSSAFSNRKDAVENLNARLIINYGSNIELSIVQNVVGGKYEVRHNDVVYYPVFEAAITVGELRVLAIELANYIAQPTREDWDGRNILRLIAA